MINPSYYFRKFELGKKKTQKKKHCAVWLVAAIWQSEETWAQRGHNQSALLGPEPTGHEQVCSTGAGDQELLLGTDALSSTKAARSDEIARRTYAAFLLRGYWEGIAMPGRNTENSSFPLGH